MNVASLQNSKRLFEVSGWVKTSLVYGPFKKGSVVPTETLDEIWFKNKDCPPAYDAGYLLRKLPKNDTTEWGRQYPASPKLTESGGSWYACYVSTMTGLHNDDKLYEVEADTPEDALCLLAIKLFEEGILKND